MPKMKTKKAAAKRFRRTAKGRWRHARTGRRHLLAKKPGERRRRLRRPGFAAGGDAARLRALLPYA